MRMEKPEMGIIEFEAEDIIVTSDCPMDCPDDCPFNCVGNCVPLGQ